MYTKERHKPVSVGVNATVEFSGNGVSGFIAKTDGTVTVKSQPSDTTIVDAFPVTAGQALPLPFIFPSGESSGSVTTAGGASGILAI